MKLKLIFLCVILLLTTLIKSQDTINVYKTFEDFKNNNGEKMNEYIGISGLAVSVSFKNGNEIVKL